MCKRRPNSRQIMPTRLSVHWYEASRNPKLGYDLHTTHRTDGVENNDPASVTCPHSIIALFSKCLVNQRSVNLFNIPSIIITLNKIMRYPLFSKCGSENPHIFTLHNKLPDEKTVYERPTKFAGSVRDTF